MATRHRTTSIPPAPVVRTVGLILLLLDIILAILVGLNLELFGWFGWPLLAATVGGLYFPIKAIQTGDPEWVLLDLIFGP